MPHLRGLEIALNRMLSSWKEIAHFFGKGVRTVQRWEKTLNLPIRRPPGAPSNVVLARTSDLEAWMHRGPGKAAIHEADAGTGASEEPISDSLVGELESEVRALVVRAGGKVATMDAGSDASAVQRLSSLLLEVRTASLGSEHGEHRLRKVA